jgi:hypothetical protein
MTHLWIERRKLVTLIVLSVAIGCPFCIWGIAASGTFMANCPISEPYCDVGLGGKGYPLVQPFIEDGFDSAKHGFQVGDNRDDNWCSISPNDCWTDYLACLRECDVLHDLDPTDHQNCYGDCGNDVLAWCHDGIPPGCVD